MKVRTIEEATVSPTQHRKPCGDCPWSRKSVAGWLGGLEPNDWIQIARSDHLEHCHTVKNQQCAGLAVFRSNICKLPMPPALKLPSDRVGVFASVQEFTEHHDIFEGEDE